MFLAELNSEIEVGLDPENKLMRQEMLPTNSDHQLDISVLMLRTCGGLTHSGVWPPVAP